MMVELKTFYGSFGTGQTFANNSVLIKAANINEAIQGMQHSFAGKYCSVYDESYADSEFFQTPIMEIHVKPVEEYDDYLDVKCKALFPEHLHFTPEF